MKWRFSTPIASILNPHIHRFLLQIPFSITNNGHGRRVLLFPLHCLCCSPAQGSCPRSKGREWGRWARHTTSSLAAAPTGLQAVLVAGSALEGFEGIREAVAKYGHLAAVAHRAWDEGKAPTGLARLGMLYPLWKKRFDFISFFWNSPTIGKEITQIRIWFLSLSKSNVCQCTRFLNQRNCLKDQN